MNTPDKPLTAAQAESLTAPSEPWLSCDDCFDQIDNCVDALIGDGRALDEPMRVHLARCPACHDEAETLISLAAADQGIDPARALDAFRAHLRPPTGAPAQPERTATVLARLLRLGRTTR